MTHLSRKKIYPLKYLILFFIGLFSKIQAQNVPKQIIEIVESYMSKDTTNKRYIELVKKKLYYLENIESVVYKSEPTSIYVFGNGDSDTQHYFILFVNETNNRNYFIIGVETNLLESLKELQRKLYDTSKISGKSVNLCYGYLIENWDFQNSVEIKNK